MSAVLPPVLSDEPESQPQIPQPTMGEMADQLYELKRQKKIADQQIKPLKDQIAALEAELLSRMETEGQTLVGGHVGRASISEQTVPDIEDWDAFLTWAYDNDMTYMIKRGILSTTFAEYLATAETPPPGTKSFTRKSLNSRPA